MNVFRVCADSQNIFKNPNEVIEILRKNNVNNKITLKIPQIIYNVKLTRSAVDD